MESLTGALLVPPDRGQILGRAVWKPRWVVVSRRGAREHQLPSNPPRGPQPNRSFSQSSKLRESVVHPGEYMLGIYKAKPPGLQDDYEPAQQYPISSITDCQVQQLSHRKQGPVLPTLVIVIADKEKKRRSSRAAGLMSTKESTTTTLWFRTPPDDHHYSLNDWRQFILSKRPPISPESPASPTFTNPFSPSRSKDNDSCHLSSSRSFMTPYSRDRDRDASVSHKSGSPSLRSKRSDVSSPTSTVHPALPHRSMLPAQNYTTMLPTDIPADLPSPSESGTDEFGRDHLEGWSTAQSGRSASISSPRSALEKLDRRHASVCAGSSPAAAARETILDRAFQMRCIPGSERAVPGEEKLSSLARFDALMRDSEERWRKRDAQEREARRRQEEAWKDDETTSEEEDSDDAEDDDDDDDDDDYRLDQDHDRNRRQTLIPPATQRALEFITGRDGQPESPRTPRRATLDYDVDAFPMPPANAVYRPHTSYAMRRPSPAQRTHSQPHLAHLPQEARPPPVPSSRQQQYMAENENDEDGGGREEARRKQSLQPDSGADKRLTFPEFTKRLSGTGSLLVMQTNSGSGGGGSGSNRASAELEYRHTAVPPLPRSSVSARAGASGARRDAAGRRDAAEEARCGGWRNSVGVMGTEGGFI
ncbi:uncharacterized protein DNG_02044 [Cephalotrichum gorgonifer]|uniref:Uncharacterized protein n=1 Tax=Cephalotrichum gorgonifer TaxID=2041049 RepID=A0AAE8MU82_9PEZI|nr:uncharacterized protein DNG_02044 [Cephalotrichum gorgonifer]